MIVNNQDQFRVHQTTVPIGQDGKAATVISWIILTVGELSSPKVGKAPGINTVSGAVVIGIWGDFRGVKMVRYNALAGSESIVMRRVGAALVAVFHHDFIVDKN